MPNNEIKFSPDDKMDSRAYQIMEKAFELDIRKTIFTSHETPIEFFSTLRKVEAEGNSYLRNYSVLGHRHIPFNDVPGDDKSSYEENKLGDEEKRITAVWYPNMTPRRKKYVAMRSRINAIRRVEKAFGVNLKEFKDIDKHPRVTLHDVAKAVDDFELGRLNGLRDIEDKH